MILVVANLVAHFLCFSYGKIYIFDNFSVNIKSLNLVCVLAYDIITELEIRWVRRSAVTELWRK
jgi:hypothetical protein